MHHHGPSFLDIRLSKSDQATALKDGTALPHRFAPQAGWVSFRIEKAEDLDAAKVTIEEREEFEPHIDSGTVVYCGVDYEEILESAENGEAIVLSN